MSNAADSAGERWRLMVEEEHAQSESVREQGDAPSDSWVPFAERFRPSLDTRDPIALRLLREVEPQHSVLDVGAGGGRVALPMSMHCRSVVAVEPSASMGAVLVEEAQRHRRDNIDLVASTWEEAEVAPVDVVICVQVLYTVRDIVAFVRKLEAHAREKVLVVLGENPPYTQSNPLWPMVHGQERLKLPSLRELIPLLWDMDIYPDLEMLPPQSPRGFESREGAVEQDAAADAGGAGRRWRASLEGAALDDILEETDGQVHGSGRAHLLPRACELETRALKLPANRP